MKLYIPICKTNDPDSDSVLGEYQTTILGIFSDKKIAEESFERVEIRNDAKYGDWKLQHTCYQGIHDIIEAELDQWSPMGVD